MEDNSETWPPPPVSESSSAGVVSKNRISGLLPLCFSLLGAICIFIGNSGPSTAGLSGMAFSEAFEANEDLMGWLIVGLPLCAIGFLTGTLHWRNWPGKLAMALPMAIVVWLFLRP